MFSNHFVKIVACIAPFALGVSSPIMANNAQNPEAVVKKVIVKSSTSIKNGQVCEEIFKRSYLQVPGTKGGWVEERTETCDPTIDESGKYFRRIASFPVCLQFNATCDDDTTTSAEIAAVSKNGKTVIYTDSPAEQIGFVDISKPKQPAAMGVLALGGEPTSVAIKGKYALVGVNTSADFVDVSGHLAVIDIKTQTIVHTIDLGGQPDSVAVSPDGQYASVVIENERDEDLGDGAPPQAPAGSLIVLELKGKPHKWASTLVDLTGLADLYAGDPEPEYVDINEDNMAVVTMQENNHLALVDLRRARVVRDFSAGSVNLTNIDTEEEDPAIISLDSSLDNVLREPDGASWIDRHHFATANEGDLDGGSRGFSVFNTRGKLVYDSGAAQDHLAVRLGHYPDGRSGNKGNEPENIEYGQFQSEPLLFVASERSSLVFVYDVANPTLPKYKQTLPAGVAPEGLLAIPSRGLLIAASEEDSRDDKIRSVLNIYKYGAKKPSYPTIQSASRADGLPIPFSALSGLAADPSDKHTLYSVNDSFYQQNSIFVIDTKSAPAIITNDIVLKDINDQLSTFPAAALADDSVDADDASRINVFDVADRAALVNADKSINIDPEGIAVASDGGFWIASEGNGTVGDAGRPINSLNFVLKTDATGNIEQVFGLPAAVNDIQVRFGFEGVTEYNGSVVVAFQRAWTGEANPRIGILDPSTSTWTFAYYPLDAVESQAGGWVGLSDITALGNDEYLVVERDNQGGPDAAIKRLYQFSLAGVADGGTVSKTLVKDLVPELQKTGGLVPEKIEGLAVSPNGQVWINNDNDGVDDNSGENQLIKLGKILD